MADPTTMFDYLTPTQAGTRGIPIFVDSPQGGEYKADQQYLQGNIVRYGGSTWSARVPTLGNTPPSLPIQQNAFWTLFTPGIDADPAAIATVSGNLPAINTANENIDAIKAAPAAAGSAAGSAATAATSAGQAMGFRNAAETFRDQSQTARSDTYAARDIAAGYAQDAAGVSGVDVPLFVSRQTLEGTAGKPLVNVVSTLTQGAPRWQRMSLADITAAGYPALAYFRRSDRLMPDGSTDATNGGYFVLRSDQRITPFMFGAKADGTDDSAALQAYFDFLAVVKADNNDASGSFSVASGLFIGRASGTAQTLNYNGYLRLLAIAPIKRMITLRVLDMPVWNGQMQLIGQGGLTFASRTCEVGLYNAGARRLKITGGVEFSRFSYAGYTDIKGATNTSLADLGNVRAYGCGTVTVGVAGGAPVANWTARTKSGASGNIGQSDTLDVDAMPPIMLDDYLDVGSGHLFVKFGNDLYYVNSMDRANNKLSVYPWLPSAAAPGQLTYIFGGAVCVPGGSDHNVHGIGQLDASYCGIALGIACLYPPTSDRIVTQACAIGMAFGGRPSSSCLGGETRAFYFESNTFDIVQVVSSATAGAYHKLTSDYALTLSKCIAIGARNTDDTFASNFTTFNNLSINYKGRQYEFEKPEKGGILGSRYVLSLARAFRSLVFKVNAWIIDIDNANLADLNRLMGYDSAELIFIGTGTNSSPTGSFVFNSPAGSTINGGTATATISGVGSGPARFLIQWDRVTNNYSIVKT